MTQVVRNYEDEICEIAKDDKFVVFLCGPSMEDLSIPSASFRKLLKDEMESQNFDVVLGENDGLIALQNEYGCDAQTNELRFLERKANAVVLIADSPGSFAELGLFSHFHSELNRVIPFIVVLSKEYASSASYIAYGPAQIVDAYGKVLFFEFKIDEPAIDFIRGNILRALNVARFKTMTGNGNAKH